MKHLKITALIMVAIMMLATTCFAAVDTDKVPLKYALSASTLEVEAGVDTEVTIYVKPEFVGANAADNAEFYNYTASADCYIQYPEGLSALKKSKITYYLNTGLNAKVNNTDNRVAGFYFADTNGIEVPETLMEIVFTIPADSAKAGSSFTFKAFSDATNNAAMTVGNFDEDEEEFTTAKLECALDLTSEVTITVAGSVDPQPTVNAFADFTSDFVVDAATVGGEPTDYQIGAGLGMKVSTGDLTFTDMIWSLTTADGKLYSKAIALGAVKGDVDLVATFVNGVRTDNGFGKEPVTTINFTGVNAIFKDADGAEWFTDVTDAK